MLWTRDFKLERLPTSYQPRIHHDACLQRSKSSLSKSSQLTLSLITSMCCQDHSSYISDLSNNPQSFHLQASNNVAEAGSSGTFEEGACCAKRPILHGSAAPEALNNDKTSLASMIRSGSHEKYSAYQASDSSNLRRDCRSLKRRIRLATWGCGRHTGLQSRYRIPRRVI